MNNFGLFDIKKSSYFEIIGQNRYRQDNLSNVKLKYLLRRFMQTVAMARFGNQIIIAYKGIGRVCHRYRMNGNVHFKCSQEFMKALNIEASRLLGWVNSPQEVEEEMGYSAKEADKYFKSVLTFEKKDCQLLLT